jgi:hypothetical protein
MGIKSTQYITRENAVRRIRKVSNLIKEKDYKELESVSFDPDYDISYFVNTGEPLDTSHIEKWTDGMLEDQLDNPFYRFSMFDNYCIKEEV